MDRTGRRRDGDVEQGRQSGVPRNHLRRRPAGRLQPLHQCQFSWYCDGRSDIPRHAAAWRRAQEVAYAVLFRGPRDPTHGALFYHADYVNPTWSRHMTQTTQIGRHIYYHYVSS